jgi:hypothetical protein
MKIRKNKRLSSIRSMLSQRKALSTVLATVIIVGITVAMGAIIWGVVSNLVEKNLEESQACFGILDQVKLNKDYTCYNQTSDKLQFSLIVGDIDINGILVSVAFGGRSQSATLNDSIQNLANIKNYPSGSDGVKIPDKNAGLTYLFSGITSKPLSISIIPIIGGEQCGSTDTLHEIDDCTSLLS